MSDSKDDHFELFAAILLACITISFLVCSAVLISLCCKRGQQKVDSSIYLQVSLTIINLGVNGIDNYFDAYYIGYEDSVVGQIGDSCIVLAYLLS